MTAIRQAPLLLLLCLWVGCVPLEAQQLSDTTLHIREVVVNARKLERQNMSARITQMEHTTLERGRTQSLGQLLSENSVISIKSLGRGALSTASFRGTSSSHTQISWNGVPINSPMSGGFDFSQVPVFFTDGVSLHHGAGAFRYGSGALGGNVNFENRPDDSTRVSLLAEYGSDHTFASGLRLRYGGRKVHFVTRLYYAGSENNFHYLNKVLLKDPFIERRKNAEYAQLGVLQEGYWEVVPGGRLSVIGWWQKDSRNLPPPILVNASAKEHQNTEDVRALLRYTQKRGALDWTVTSAGLWGTIDYSRLFDIGLGDLHTHSRTVSWVTTGEASGRLSSALLVGGAANYRFDRVVATSYDQSHQRHTLNGRLFAQYRPWSFLLLEGQGMAESIGEMPACTYSIGASFVIPQSGWTFKVSNAYNHRFPTLNDLYWTPGGNPDLQPERGSASDASVGYALQGLPLELKGEVTAYYMDIANWIMWIPTGNGYIWEPANFSRVVSKGAELNVTLGGRMRKTLHRVLFNYTYTHSTDRSSRADGTYGKQLPYVPRTKWNVTYSLRWKALEASYTTAFTDARFTSADQSYYTNAYLIHNLYCAYELPIKSSRLKATLRVDNLFNAYYESTQYYPMPLRNFNVGLQWFW